MAISHVKDFCNYRSIERGRCVKARGKMGITRLFPHRNKWPSLQIVGERSRLKTATTSFCNNRLIQMLFKTHISSTFRITIKTSTRLYHTSTSKMSSSKQKTSALAQAEDFIDFVNASPTRKNSVSFVKSFNQSSLIVITLNLFRGWHSVSKRKHC